MPLRPGRLTAVDMLFDQKAMRWFRLKKMAEFKHEHHRA
jgi:hypothetical protein